MKAFVGKMLARRLSVGQRLLLINGLLLIALTLVAAMSWRATNDQRTAMSDLSLVSRAARYHQDLDAQNTNIRAEVHAALASSAFDSIPHEEVKAALAEDMTATLRDMHELDRMVLSDELGEALASIRNLEDSYRSMAGDTVRTIFENPRAAGPLLETFNASYANLQDAMLKLTGVLARRIIAANTAADAASQTAKRWLLITVIATGLTVCGLVALLSASIRRSLRQVGLVANAIAAGDLNARADSSGSDEVATLAAAMNKLADNLSGIMDRLRAESERDAFSSQLMEALEMANSEADAYGVVARVMNIIAPDKPMELLVADSSRVHLERAAQHPVAGSPGCGVDSPFDCVAVRRGSITTFPDSAAVNSCPQLRDRACGRLSAVCVPLSFMGRSLGVLHVAGPAEQIPVAQQLSQLSSLAQQSASRVGTLRAFQRTQIQASTDSLTGLMNRRSLEAHVRKLNAAGRHYAFVLCDLDNFKKLNDAYGHDAGDNALRLFAEVLRSCMRDHDMAARWGGEEFAIVLAHCNASQALEAVDRIRAALAQVLVAGAGPVFTCSFGIADSDMATQLEQLLRVADDALYDAKESGRDRGMIAIKRAADAGIPRRNAEHLVSLDLAMVDAQGNEQTGNINEDSGSFLVAPTMLTRRKG